MDIITTIYGANRGRVFPVLRGVLFQITTHDIWKLVAATCNEIGEIISGNVFIISVRQFPTRSERTIESTSLWRSVFLLLNQRSSAMREIPLFMIATWCERYLWKMLRKCPKVILPRYNCWWKIAIVTSYIHVVTELNEI